MQVAGHQLQLRVLVRRPARVVHGHPAIQVRLHVVSRHGQHVVGHPRHVRRQVRRLDAVLPLPGVVDLPHQRWPAVQVLGDLGEPVLLGVHAGDDLVADLPHRRVVEGQQSPGDFLLTAGAVVHARADQRDVAADVLLQQALRVEQIELVVLLEDAEPRGLAQRAEVHRRRVHRRRDVEKPQVQDAIRQRDLAHVAHERDVRVVDRHRQLGLILDRRRDDAVVDRCDRSSRRESCHPRPAGPVVTTRQDGARRPAPGCKRNSHVAPPCAGYGAFMGRTEEGGKLAVTNDE